MSRTGRLVIYTHKSRVDAAFRRATQVSDPELLADYAKYLCILVSGYLEKAFSEIVLEHAREVAAPSVQRFVERTTRRFTNANSEKILKLLGNFDNDWKSSMEAFLIDERKAAVDSVLNLRNSIAHGSNIGLTFTRMQTYYSSIVEVVDYAQNLCIPLRPTRG